MTQSSSVAASLRIGTHDWFPVDKWRDATAIFFINVGETCWFHSRPQHSQSISDNGKKISVSTRFLAFIRRILDQKTNRDFLLYNKKHFTISDYTNAFFYGYDFYKTMLFLHRYMMSSAPVVGDVIVKRKVVLSNNSSEHSPWKMWYKDKETEVPP